MAKIRLDNYLVKQGKIKSRSQAENYIKLGFVKVDGEIIKQASRLVNEKNVVVITSEKIYVSRAAFKLDSVTSRFGLDFRNKAVLDVGSSTGGFTDYALKHGAAKVVAVDVGTNQMDGVLRLNQKVELHEQTDIRHVNKLSTKVNFVLIDVSFISIKEVLTHLPKIIEKDCLIVAMVKPQFELSSASKLNKGVIKNESIRRQVLKEFEQWAKHKYKLIDKADSDVQGQKGNRERFYLIKLH